MPLSRRGLLAAAALAPLIGGVNAWAEDEVPTSRARLADEGRYLPRWLELTDEAGELARLRVQYGDDKDWIPHILRDGLTQYASFMGAEAIAFSAETSSTAPSDPDAWEAEEAVEGIARAARDHRVVMLNEAHNASRHRALLGRLLPRLHADGFTHLSAEAFTDKAAALASGDPVDGECGHYLSDPVFAEAVRQALALGYSLFAHEQRADQRLAGSTLSDNAMFAREQAQAENLAALLAREPDARVLVFVGYGHVGENDGGEMFATRFKRDTGINPLTIGQAGVGAFGPHADDAPSVRALLDHFRPERAVLLRPRTPQPGVLTAENTDFLVLHPALPDVEGRPAWLAHDAQRRRIEVATPAGAGPRLLQAIHAADPDPAIPADQFLIPDAGGPAVLWLKPGRYRIRLETPAGFAPMGEVVA